MTTETLSREVSRHAGWSIFMGILTAAVGAVMIIYPLATAAASTVFFGAALLVAAVAQLVFAFTSDTAGQFLLKLLLGILYGVAGLSLIALPGMGVVTLTAVLGAMLIADAVVEIGHRLLGSRGGRPRLVLLQRLLQPAPRDSDHRAVAGQLDLGDRDDGRRRRPLQRNHAHRDLELGAQRSAPVPAVVRGRVRFPPGRPREAMPLSRTHAAART